MAARTLLHCATTHGADSLGVDAGAVQVGKYADFALVDLDAPALAAVSDTHLLGAAVLGGSAEGLIQNTCVAGTWTRTL